MLLRDRGCARAGFTRGIDGGSAVHARDATGMCAFVPLRLTLAREAQASSRAPKRRWRFWKSRIASKSVSRVKSGQNTGVNHSSE